MSENSQTDDTGQAGTNVDLNSSFNSKHHIAFLDGMRGLAAFYVAIFHCHLKAQGNGSNIVTKLGSWSNWMNYGHYSVCVFIVLSGFVLMLASVDSPNYRLKGGIFGFIKRRFWRIFPPYWASLLLSIALVIVAARLHLHQNTLTEASIWSHVFMLQNLFQSLSTTIDGSMWSIGVEWDIYLVYCLMLLPFVRRFGHVVTMVFSIVLGICIHYLLPSVVCPWFIGLFAMGMSAAIICSRSYPAQHRRKLGNLCGGLTIVFVMAGALWHPHFLPIAGIWGSLIFSDLCFGFATMLFITYYILTGDVGIRRLFTMILENKNIVKFGTFSYSFYLIHQIVIFGFAIFIGKFWTGNAELVALLASMPFVIAISYLFYLVFEKRFIKTRQPNTPLHSLFSSPDPG